MYIYIYFFLRGEIIDQIIGREGFGKNSHVREWDERERSLKQGMLGRDRQESDWERETFIG